VIQVQARHDVDNWCEISVTDDGPGVPAAAQERIFKLFQTATAAERGGSGLGPGPDQARGRGAWRQHHRESPVMNGRGACFRLRWPRFPRRTSDD
jgi:K+-sensing histidine kinase KdpD